MCIKKNLSILTALACSLVLSSAAVAEEFRCEVTSYSGALGALKKGVTNKMTMIKSWIPANFTLNNCGLTFEGYEQILIDDGFPKNGLYFATEIFKFDGKTMRPKYRIHIQEEGKGYISLKLSSKHKKMGPVPIMCELVQESPSTCPEQEDQ